MRNFDYNPRINSNIKQKKSSILLSQVVTILLTISLLFCMTTFLMSKTYFTAEVEGSSMFPTINYAYETTKINDTAYYTFKNKAKKGDIIIVDYKYASKNLDAIKRLIATGGDTVCYYNGNILVNGQVLKEPYMEEDYKFLQEHPEYLEGSDFSSADDWKNKCYNKSKTNFETWCSIIIDPLMTDEQKDAKLRDTTFFKNYASDYEGSVVYNPALETYVLTVPENFVFFLGDNRYVSSDSSEFGPLEKESILAKVEFIATNDLNVFAIFTKQILHYFG